MRKIAVLCILGLLIVSGCSEKSESKSKNKQSKKEIVEKITLKNDLEVTIKKKELLDAYGDYYAKESGAILVLHIEVKNPTDKKLTVGSSYMKLHINSNSQTALGKTLVNLDEVMSFIEEVPSKETIKKTLVYGSNEKYTKKDKTFIEFYDILEKPLGNLDVDLTALEKTMSEATLRPNPVKEKEGVYSQEMNKFEFSVNAPVVLNSEEFHVLYPESSLGIKDEYRYVIFDATYVNGTDNILKIKQAHIYVDYGGEHKTREESVKMKRMNGEGMNFENDFSPKETRTGKIVFIVPVGTAKITLSTNPVGGMNSTFEIPFDINTD